MMKEQLMGLKVDLDADRFVAAAFEDDAYYLFFQNKGVSTRISMTVEAMNALISIVGDLQVQELRNELGIVS